MQSDGVAVVTGASRGIGRAIALELAGHGLRVVAVARSAADLERLRDEIAGTGGACVPAPCDVADGDALAALPALCMNAFAQPASVLVNAAGVADRSDIATTTEHIFRRILDTNLIGAFTMMRTLLDGMVRSGGGRVVNISSVFGHVGHSNRSAYAASKGAMNMMTRQAAVELGPFGITVNAIAPGLVATDMNRDYLVENADYVTRLMDRTPLGRMGTEADVAAAASFLCSSAADYITGQVLYVDGGMSVS